MPFIIYYLLPLAFLMRKEIGHLLHSTIRKVIWAKIFHRSGRTSKCCVCMCADNFSKWWKEVMFRESMFYYIFQCADNFYHHMICAYVNSKLTVKIWPWSDVFWETFTTLKKFILRSCLYWAVMFHKAWQLLWDPERDYIIQDSSRRCVVR